MSSRPRNAGNFGLYLALALLSVVLGVTFRQDTRWLTAQASRISK